jgi:hypothetical protein
LRIISDSQHNRENPVETFTHQRQWNWRA